MFRIAKRTDFNEILKLKNQIHKKHIEAEPKIFKNITNTITIEYFEEEVKKGNIYI